MGLLKDIQLIARLAVGQRLAVAASCCALIALLHFEQLRSNASYAILALLTVLACVEKVCSVLNTISVERDFVVVLAAGDERQLLCK
jgi:iron-regulated transporter 1